MEATDENTEIKPADAIEEISSDESSNTSLSDYPESETAGELLDRLGLKGFRVGSAQISTKHANFVQADPGGSSGDVNELIRTVAERVFDEVGVELRTEIRRIGFEA